MVTVSIIRKKMETVCEFFSQVPLMAVGDPALSMQCAILNGFYF